MSVSEPRLRADAERNRVRVLRAAAAVIARDGVNVGVDAIAREAGVGVGTIYRRFASKDDLVRAILAQHVEDTLAQLAQATAVDDPWEALAAAMHVLAGRFAQDQGLLDAVAAAGSRLVLVEVRSRLIAALEPVLARAREAGVVREDVAVTDLTPLASMVTRLSASMRAADPRIWERFLAVVLDGLRPGSASPLPRTPLPKRL
jgi:AcrR family transcriptional regulator